MPRILLACAVFLLGSCAREPRPDLGRLYAMQANPNQPPVVLVHGLLGSRLVRATDGREVWPGSTWRLLFHDYASLALDIDPDTLEPRPGELVTGGITDRAAGRDFYASVIEVLQEAGGYTLAKPGRPPPGKALYVFTYDWRRDNVATARALDSFIERIRADHGDPGLEVDIVAHSMGGLAVRYYLRYGTVDVLDGNEFPVNGYGAGRVRRTVLLGTPNLGSAKAIRSFLEGFEIGFDRIPPEVVATFPSAYQLFPHPIVPWLVTVEGRSLERDLFDIEIWRRFQFSLFSPEVEARLRLRHGERADEVIDTLRRHMHKRLERGRRFVWSLTVPAPDAPVRHIVFGGDCHLTPARIVVEEVRGESVIRLWPREIRGRVPGVDYRALMLEPGDGVVTKASLLARQAVDPTIERHRYSFFPLQYAFFLCEAHDALTANIHFQDNLLHALLSADDLSP